MGDTCRAIGNSGCSLEKLYVSYSQLCFESGFTIDGLSFNEVFNEEFIKNQMGKSLQEYFMEESDGFMRMLSHSGQRKRKVTMKKGKVSWNGP